MAAAAKQRVREFLDEQTQKLVTLRAKGVSMTTPGTKAGENILRLLDTKCCTEWRPETFAYPIVIISSMRLQVFKHSLCFAFLYVTH
jgi:hypothetical protein